MRSGAYVLPLYKGRPPPELIQELSLAQPTATPSGAGAAAGDPEQVFGRALAARRLRVYEWGCACVRLLDSWRASEPDLSEQLATPQWASYERLPGHQVHT